MSGSTRLVITLVVILILTSGLCFYIAESQFSELYLASLLPTHVSGKAHDLIAFDQRDNLIGVSMLDGKFQIDVYNTNPETPQVHAEIPWGGPKPAQWMLGHDGRTIAWLTGTNRISLQRVAIDGQPAWPSPRIVVAPSPLVTFGVLQDGSSIGMVLSRGELIQKDSAT